MTKSPNDAFLRTFPRLSAKHICILKKETRLHTRYKRKHHTAGSYTGKRSACIIYVGAALELEDLLHDRAVRNRIHLRWWFIPSVHLQVSYTTGRGEVDSVRWFPSTWWQHYRVKASIFYPQHCPFHTACLRLLSCSVILTASLRLGSASSVDQLSSLFLQKSVDLLLHDV